MATSKNYRDGTFADGNFGVPSLNGPPVFSAPFDDIPDKLILTQPYVQRALDYASGPLIPKQGSTGNWGLKHPVYKSYELVDEANVRSEGALIAWDRIFAATPRERDLCESFSYARQIYSGGDSPRIAEVASNVNSRIHLTYGPKERIQAKTPLVARRAIILNNTLTWIGTEPEEGATEIVAEDSVSRQWRGNIWEFRVRWVTP